MRREISLKTPNHGKLHECMQRPDVCAGATMNYQQMPSSPLLRYLLHHGIHAGRLVLRQFWALGSVLPRELDPRRVSSVARLVQVARVAVEELVFFGEKWDVPSAWALIRKGSSANPRDSNSRTRGRLAQARMADRRDPRADRREKWDVALGTPTTDG